MSEANGLNLLLGLNRATRPKLPPFVKVLKDASCQKGVNAFWRAVIFNVLYVRHPIARTKALIRFRNAQENSVDQLGLDQRSSRDGSSAGKTLANRVANEIILYTNHEQIPLVSSFAGYR
ncbi:hypothetical protein IB234_23370 [Pseudomonas sp. PDM16]|uniref:hypothetical protein n=1 Tax=Pseudomonas sp. PDM16 TaxID=2769292 RepID=UPI00177B6636|nr:hypothetical protein [Pseudomonas sp. PDM16]MBD9417516.1 hypothetical protein [Pseudomonas sp. PDM16]